MSEIIVEEVRKIEEEGKRNLLKGILKDFQATLENVSIIDGKTVTTTNSDGEHERPATYEDSVDFILSGWNNLSERLLEAFDIDLDEE